jgi:hypothetical protein
MEPVKIRTRQEHRVLIRRIWTLCIVMAVLVFATTGGVVLALFLAGYESKKIVEVSTSIFQVLVLSYGLGFFVPAFLTSLLTMHLGVDMSRQGLEIGQETAKHISQLQGDLKSMVEGFRASLGRAEMALVKAEETLSGIKDKISSGQKEVENKLENSLAQEVLGAVLTGPGEDKRVKSGGARNGENVSDTDEACL